jgi:hypothetical protein
LEELANVSTLTGVGWILLGKTKKAPQMTKHLTILLAFMMYAREPDVIFVM